jgi:hypothetical protein
VWSGCNGLRLYSVSMRPACPPSAAAHKQGVTVGGSGDQGVLAAGHCTVLVPSCCIWAPLEDGGVHRAGQRGVLVRCLLN